MSEPLWQRIRRWISQPIPVRRETAIATWWEWGGRGFRLRRKEQP